MGIWEDGKTWTPENCHVPMPIAVTIVMRFSTSPSDNWIRGSPVLYHTADLNSAEV